MDSATVTAPSDFEPDTNAAPLAGDLHPSGGIGVTVISAQLLEGESPSKPKREVVVDIIEEGFGNSRDGHYYSAQLLEAYADQFVGASMYSDHLDAETERKLGGMPRSIRDKMGRIIEASVQTNEVGKRVIRARCSITQPWLWNLLESDPGAVGLSINARGVSRPGRIQGRQAKLVESITNVRSVDWVSEAGAGGKVIQLIEAQIAAENDTTEETPVNPADAPARSDEHVEEPADADVDLTEGDDDTDPTEADELTEGEPDEDADEDLEEGDVDDDEETDALLAEAAALSPAEKKAWAEKMAAARAKKSGGRKPGADDEDEDDEDDLEEGGTNDPLITSFTGHPDGQAWIPGTPPSADQLHAVINHPEVRPRIFKMIESAVARGVADRLSGAVDDALTEANASFDELADKVQADADRRVEQVTQRFKAAALIEAANFKPITEQRLKEDLFDIYVEADVDPESGEVLREADQVLQETVAEAIEAKKQEVGSYGRARVTGLGGDLREARTVGDGAKPKATAPRRAKQDDIINQRLS